MCKFFFNSDGQIYHDDEEGHVPLFIGHNWLKEFCFFLHCSRVFIIHNGGFPKLWTSWVRGKLFVTDSIMFAEKNSNQSEARSALMLTTSLCFSFLSSFGSMILWKMISHTTWRGMVNGQTKNLHRRCCNTVDDSLQWCEGQKFDSTCGWWNKDPIRVEKNAKREEEWRKWLRERGTSSPVAN